MQSKGLVILVVALLALAVGSAAAQRLGDIAVYEQQHHFGLLQETPSPTNFTNVTTNATTTKAPLPRVSMGWKAWVSLFTCVGVLVVLGLEMASTTGVMVTATTFLTLCGIITIQQLFAGLSNNGVISIALLFIIADPLAELPIIKRLFDKLLEGGSGRTYWPCFKVSIVSMIVSAFTNNAPQVALLTPLIKNYCRDNNLAASQILLPMSFSTLIGGTWCLIGTSTNLIYDGLIRAAGMKPMGFFELAIVAGIPSLIYLAYLTFAPTFLLPNERGGMFKFVKEHGREFFAELRVLPTSQLVGKGVGDVRAKMPADGSLRVVEIVRGGVSLFPLEDTQVILAEDHIVFSGEVEALQRQAVKLGLTFVTEEEIVEEVAVQTRRRGLSQHHLGGSTSHNTSFVEPHVARRASVFEDHGDGETQADRGDEASERTGLKRTHSSADVEMTNAAAIRLAAQTGHIPDIVVHGAETDAQRASRTSNEPFDAAAVSEAGAAPTVAAEPATEAESEAQQQQEEGAAPPATTFFEAVIGPDNASIGQPVSSRHFQLQFRCAILACRTRSGDDLTGSALRSHVIAHGDTMLVLAQATFRNGLRIGRDFHVVSRAGKDFEEHAADDFFILPAWFPFGQLIQPHVSAAPLQGLGASASPREAEETGAGPAAAVAAPVAAPGATQDAPPPPPSASAYRAIPRPTWYPYLITPVFLAVVIAAAAFDINIALAAIVGVCAVLIMQISTVPKALESVDFNMLIMVGFSFGLGSALVSSNLAKVIGQLVVDANLHGFPLLLLIGVTSTIISNLVISQAAAQVLFPIVYQVYVQQNEDPRPGILCLVCCTSCSFSTYWSSNTSLMVMGPGGYKARDFFKFGGCLNIITMVTLPLSTAIMYNVW